MTFKNSTALCLRNIHCSDSYFGQSTECTVNRFYRDHIFKRKWIQFFSAVSTTNAIPFTSLTCIWVEAEISGADISKAGQIKRTLPAHVDTTTGMGDRCW